MWIGTPWGEIPYYRATFDTPNPLRGPEGEPIHVIALSESTLQANCKVGFDLQILPEPGEPLDLNEY